MVMRQTRGTEIWNHTLRRQLLWWGVSRRPIDGLHAHGVYVHSVWNTAAIQNSTHKLRGVVMTIEAQGVSVPDNGVHVLCDLSTRQRGERRVHERNLRR